MEIKGVDYEVGLARFRNNTDRFMKVLYKFASGTEMPEVPFDEAVLPENVAETKTRIHTLKGVAGNLAINELFRLCSEFEKTLAAGAPDSEVYEQLYKEYADVRNDILAKAAPGVTETAVNRSNRNDCMSLLADLRQNAEKYDAAACEPIVKKLRANKWRDLDQALIDSVISFIENYDFEDAVMLIDSMSLS